MIAFHILKQDQAASMLYLAQWIEKAYLNNSKLFIFTDNEQKSKEIDNFLWAFSDARFLPHHLLDEEHIPAPILISHRYLPEERNILVNLSCKVPDFFTTFSAIFELVYEDEEIKKIGRIKYRQYQAAACSIEVINPVSYIAQG